MTIKWIFVFIFLTSCTQRPSNKLEESQVTLALSQAPSTLDPRKAVSAAGMRITSLIFQSLVRLDRHLKVQPSLARRWTLTDNTYTFYIPKGVVFSNGRPLGKEDIQFSFQEYRSPKSPFHSAFKVIQEVRIQETKNEFQVVVKLKQYSAGFLSTDLPVLKILPKKEILAHPDSQQWIGTGPFTLVYQDNNQIHLQSRGNTSIQKVVFKVVRDDLTLYQKILREEVDIVQNELSYLKVDKILQNSKLPYQLFKKEGLSVNYLIFNMKDSLFQHKKARKAVALGLNIKDLIQYKFKNYVLPASSILHPRNPFFSEIKHEQTYQPEQAKRMLQLWGHKKVTLKTSNNKEVVSYARWMADQLRQLGLKVELKSYEWGVFYKDLNRGNFQIALLRWVGAFDPDIYRVAFHSSEKPPRGRNRGFYTNRHLDTLLEKGKQERNLQKRIQIYRQVQNMIRQDLPIVPLWHNLQLSLVKKQIKGYFLPANGSYDYLTSISKK